MWLNFSDATILNMDDDFSSKPWLAEVTTANLSEDVWVKLTIISGPKKTKAPFRPHPIPGTPKANVPGFHPIHLHGHDFAILAQCVPDDDHDCSDVANATLNLANPPRRDVAFLPNGGYLVMGFKADNPGVWIMHCHIAFHASSGLALQIVENWQQTKFNKRLGWLEEWQGMCDTWTAWSPDNSSDPCMDDKKDEDPLQEDSGI